MKRRTLLALTLTMPLLVGCATGYAGLPPLAASPAEAYRLGSGDEIRVSVFGFDALNGTYAVSDVGMVAIPLLGAVPVQGHSTDEVETILATILRSRDIAPKASVSVQVQKYRPFYILGEVQKPGEFPYAPGMTILKAVSIAGGYTFRADTKQAIVTRSGAHPERARANPMDAIRPGDTILVPEAWF
jgi:polysaccharide export outer membrane protein